MQLAYQSSDLRIDNPAQAAAFASQLRCRILLACARREMSLSALHREFDVPLPKLHYHVVRLVDVGLLEIARSEARAGRPIRYYRAVAARFWVPQALLPDMPADGWAAGLRQALKDENNRSGDISLLYASDPVGKMIVRLVRAEGSAPPRTIEIWRRMRLDPAQRAALGKELAELLERYARAPPGKSTDLYLVHAAFAPLGVEP